ncbi:uncharacterized protein EDB91DRAFT_1087745 [Suillus paluster]|uniref:uncharacterized protein n=1 Tax=Suillus paluster TaxID=48578 RepID=UPI001B8731D7|nr:uncharacterized protein EDB91DRAFT_1087745 [Suillus paluster]KAG1723673.1 hypothetical protein EDB91DRAFT_1087745 [Suillus paluster]
MSPHLLMGCSLLVALSLLSLLVGLNLLVALSPLNSMMKTTIAAVDIMMVTPTTMTLESTMKIIGTPPSPNIMGGGYNHGYGRLTYDLSLRTLRQHTEMWTSGGEDLER